MRGNGYEIAFLFSMSRSLRRIFRYCAVPIWQRYGPCLPLFRTLSPCGIWIYPGMECDSRSTSRLGSRRRRALKTVSPRPRRFSAWTHRLLHQPRHRGPDYPARHRCDRCAGRECSRSTPGGIFPRHSRHWRQARVAMASPSACSCRMPRNWKRWWRAMACSASALRWTAARHCCEVRRCALRRALASAAGWVTGLRRGQSAGRGEVAFAEWDAALDLVKINPLADWPLERVEAYAAANERSHQPAACAGLPSIGCQPCTRAIRPGEHIRAGALVVGAGGRQGMRAAQAARRPVRCQGGGCSGVMIEKLAAVRGVVQANFSI